MRRALLLFLAAGAALCGCTVTRVYGPNGKKIFETTGNAEGLNFKWANGIALTIKKLDHATATLAGGKAASDKISAIGGALAMTGFAALFK